MDELEKLRKENEELKKKAKEFELMIEEQNTAKWFETAQRIQDASLPMQGMAPYYWCINPFHKF